MRCLCYFFLLPGNEKWPESPGQISVGWSGMLCNALMRICCAPRREGGSKFNCEVWLAQLGDMIVVENEDPMLGLRGQLGLAPHSAGRDADLLLSVF